MTPARERPVGPTRARHPPRVQNAGRPASPKTNATALLVGFLAALAIVMGAFPGGRQWALSSLGYGLIPVGLWVAGFLSALCLGRPPILRWWKFWTASALGVATSLASLSLVYPSGGVMQEVSMGGHWGGYLGGSPMALGATKAAAILLTVPLVLVPSRSGLAYTRVARRLLQALLSPARAGWNWLAASAIETPPEGSEAKVKSGKRRSIVAKVTKGLKNAQGTILGSTHRGRSARGRKGQLAVSAAEPGAGGAPVGTGGEKTGWSLPPLDMLSKGESRPVPQAVLHDMARRVEETLGDHKVEVSVQDIRVGPRVIRFGLVPGWMTKYGDVRSARGKGNDTPPVDISRVKVQSILVREKDLALALKTPNLRLEAPVPGESLVGLEVPSPLPRTVVLRSVAEGTAFQHLMSKGGLPVALGEDTGGAPVVADLSELPHLLIAGATGSGKSVCINSVVASLLVSNGPDRVRMLMVDPKRVELTPFNGLPHLIVPVIVEVEQVLQVLKAVQAEMLRRYKLMEQSGVRNIEGYNKKATVRMPALVLVIDELADLMMAAAYEAEQALVRLAQLGRATGIHLILATQRPSVNVVTGLLKANVPARIAFAVASQVDSRVILDSVGAEKLLGKGDMLLVGSGSPKPLRVQGTFVHDRDIEKLVQFWRKSSGPSLPQIVLDGEDTEDSEEGLKDEDELLARARDLADRYPRLSPSVIQRRLQVGYPKAVRLLKLLKEEDLLATDDEAGVWDADKSSVA